MNIKEQIEREAERYARNEWGDAYKGILPDDIIQKGEDAYANSFIKGANFALEMDRWVKVEDGLPDEDKLVWFYSQKSGGVFYGYYVKNWHNSPDSFIFWDKGFNRIFQSGTIKDAHELSEPISHYMYIPLPKLPQ